MTAPTESGWYWALREQRWEVVYYSKSQDHVLRCGNETELDVWEFKQWGERIQRKEVES